MIKKKFKCFFELGEPLGGMKSELDHLVFVEHSYLRVNRCFLCIKSLPFFLQLNCFCLMFVSKLYNC